MLAIWISSESSGFFVLLYTYEAKFFLYFQIELRSQSATNFDSQFC